MRHGVASREGTLKLKHLCVHTLGRNEISRSELHRHEPTKMYKRSKAFRTANEPFTAEKAP